MRTTNIEMRMNQDKKRGSNSKKKTQTKKQNPKRSR